MTTTPHIELRAVTKRFGGTTALADVDLTIARGSVHALVGENGAGKSTLGKLVAGVHTADSGELLVAGQPVQFRSPRQALDHRLTLVAQELSLVPSRTVVENVFLGREDHLGPLVQRKALRRRFDALVARCGIDVPGDALAGALAVAEQQKVEILRALARDAELIVMDEPSARLTATEAKVLGRIVRSLAASGTTVVFVSHFLDEVLAISDVLTVMRDGRAVRTGPTSEESHDRIIEAMIGRKLESTFPPKVPPSLDAPEVLRVENLSRRGAFQDVSFSVHAGEILVLAGLVGAGRSEVVRAVYGADQSDGGRVLLRGQPLRAAHPAAAIRRGVAMVPEDRKAQGLQQVRSVRENITIPHLRLLSVGGVVRRRAESRRSSDIIASVGVKSQSPEHPVSALSGGNQQKVLFARSLLTTPKLLIADEPTRGVDVGAKRGIYDLVAHLATQGMAVLIVSSELEEVLGLAHRVLVMRGGSVTGEFSGDAISEHNVIKAAFGAVPDFADDEEHQ